MIKGGESERIEERGVKVTCQKGMGTRDGAVRFNRAIRSFLRSG